MARKDLDFYLYVPVISAIKTGVVLLWIPDFLQRECLNRRASEEAGHAYGSARNSVSRMVSSGGFRNLERGVQSENFMDCHAHFRSRWKSELNI